MGNGFMIKSSNELNKDSREINNIIEELIFFASSVEKVSNWAIIIMCLSQFQMHRFHGSKKMYVVETYFTSMLESYRPITK